MPENPTKPYPTVTPYLLYEDVPAALEWLTKAFGFRERLRFTAEDGTVNHAEMQLADGVILLGDPGEEYRNPKRSGGGTVVVCVYVDDVDAHHQRASAAGATILSQPQDQSYGDRSYNAEDPEGHRWTFLQHVRDVAPSDWGATTS